MVYLCLQGCVTDWEQVAISYRDEETMLTVNSTPQGKLYIDNIYVGETPITTPLVYQQKISVEGRGENLWYGKPFVAFIITAGTLGVFLPATFTYTDADKKEISTGDFFYNKFDVRIEAENYQVWQQQLECKGESNMQLFPKLDPQ